MAESTRRLRFSIDDYYSARAGRTPRPTASRQACPRDFSIRLAVTLVPRIIILLVGRAYEYFTNRQIQSTFIDPFLDLFIVIDLLGRAYEPLRVTSTPLFILKGEYQSPIDPLCNTDHAIVPSFPIPFPFDVHP
jgi:hypothetical protein